MNAPACPNPAAEGTTSLGTLNEDGTEPGFLSCYPCICKEAAALGLEPWGRPGESDQVELFS